MPFGHLKCSYSYGIQQLFLKACHRHVNDNAIISPGLKRLTYKHFLGFPTTLKNKVWQLQTKLL